MRTQEERDKQTLDIMMIVLAVAGALVAIGVVALVVAGVLSLF